VPKEAHVPNVAERAVKEFESSREKLNTFVGDPDIREIMKEYEQLVDDYNQTLDTAVRAVKSHLRTLEQKKLVVGIIGAQKRYKRWYDANFLANSLPSAQADLILTEVVEYKLNTELLEQLSRQGEIDNEIVRQAYHEEEDSPAAMPGTPKAYVIPAVPDDD